VHAAQGDRREVAEAVRPTPEAFMRIAYHQYFPPGFLLGPFRGLCEQRVNTADQILNQGDIDELRRLTDYAKQVSPRQQPCVPHASHQRYRTR
jgi:hypothetical protein